MKFAVSLLVALLLMLALALPASAHPGHRSCDGFGGVSASLGQSHQLAGLIGGVIAVDPTSLGDVVALEHGLFCQA